MTRLITVRGYGSALSFEQLTVTGSAVAPTIAPTVRSCVVTVDGGKVRWRADGGNPTSTVGHLLDIAQSMEFYGTDCTNLRFIAVDGSPTVAVTSFG